MWIWLLICGLSPFIWLNNLQQLISLTDFCFARFAWKDQRLLVPDYSDLNIWNAKYKIRSPVHDYDIVQVHGSTSISWFDE